MFFLVRSKLRSLRSLRRAPKWAMAHWAHGAPYEEKHYIGFLTLSLNVTAIISHEESIGLNEGASLRLSV